MSKPEGISQWAWDEADRVMGDLPAIIETTDVQNLLAFVARSLDAAYAKGQATLTAERDAAIAERDELVKALERAKQGWGNVLELDLLPEKHRPTAEALLLDSRTTLARIKGNGQEAATNE